MATCEYFNGIMIEFVYHLFIRDKLPVHIREIPIETRHRRISRNGREVLSSQGKEQKGQISFCISWNDIKRRVDWEEIAMRPCDDAWVALPANNNAWTGC